MKIEERDRHRKKKRKRGREREIEKATSWAAAQSIQRLVNSPVSSAVLKLHAYGCSFCPPYLGREIIE
jgi:hypothetical protein